MNARDTRRHATIVLPKRHCPAQHHAAGWHLSPHVGAATHDHSTGIHRPLLATALVLAPTEQSAGTRPAPIQVLVSIDHCLLWNDEMQALRERVGRDADTALDRLHITCSHTHAAGLMDPARSDLPGGDLIAPYLARMADMIADAVREALGSMQPLAIVYGQGRSSLARHRELLGCRQRAIRLRL